MKPSRPRPPFTRQRLKNLLAVFGVVGILTGFLFSDHVATLAAGISGFVLMAIGHELERQDERKRQREAMRAEVREQVLAEYHATPSLLEESRALHAAAAAAAAAAPRSARACSCHDPRCPAVGKHRCHDLDCVRARAIHP